MKVKPKDKTFDEYLESQCLNPEDLEGFDIIYIKPRDFYKRRDQDIDIKQRDFFHNDLMDYDIEIETRKKNAAKKFTERTTMSEMDELSAEDLLSYHQFLIDFKADQQSESST